MDWPIGTYTLVKPRSGCPPDWMEGWTDQDNEDSHNSNSMSYGHHFAGTSYKPLHLLICRLSSLNDSLSIRSLNSSSLKKISACISQRDRYMYSIVDMH